MVPARRLDPCPSRAGAGIWTFIYRNGREGPSVPSAPAGLFLDVAPEPFGRRLRLPVLDEEIDDLLGFVGDEYEVRKSSGVKSAWSTGTAGSSSPSSRRHRRSSG